jgi:hypothetical protein
VGPKISLDPMDKRKFFPLLGLDFQPINHPVALPITILRLTNFLGSNNFNIFFDSVPVSMKLPVTN